jgi:hypothetical protein
MVIDPRLSKTITRLTNDLQRNFGAEWRGALANLLGVMLGDAFFADDRGSVLNCVNDVLCLKAKGSNVIPQVCAGSERYV